MSLVKKECKVFYVEGPDGSGKTTLIEKIKKQLHEKGFSVLITKEPGGKHTEDIRRLLLDPADKISYATRRILFLADHIERLNYISYQSKSHDYIIIDRNAEISDKVYGHMCCDDNIKDYSDKLYSLISNVCEITKEQLYSKTPLNIKTVFINIPENLLINRITNREIVNDLNDLKDITFKVEIGRKYKVLMKEMKLKDPDNVILYNPLETGVAELIDMIDGGKQCYTV